MSLAVYIGLTGLTLGIQGIKFLLEAFLSRLARIDGTSAFVLYRFLWCLHFTPPVRPKKRGPDQPAPVISRAIAVRLR